MNLMFLAPVFLAGFAALAIPVVIHLVHRQKPQGVPFPSLMFLQQIPHKVERRQRIRHWVLFALRSLALILLAVAFARPLFEGVDRPLTAGDLGREVAILLDRSFSMGYGDRWDRALDAARDAIGGLGPNDRASIMAFDEEAVALTQPLTDRDALATVVNGIERTVRATNFGPALKLAESVFDATDRPIREVVLISDFQERGWVPDQVSRLPAGVSVRPVSVIEGERELRNVAVAGVTVRQQPDETREQATVSARLLNVGTASVTGLEVRMAANGLDVGETQVDLPAGGTRDVVFEPVLVPDGQSRWTVAIDGDDLALDDRFHFTLQAGRVLSVLILEGSGARDNQSLFLANAMQVAERPAVRVERKPLSRFRLSDAEGRSLIVLNEAAYPGGTAGQAIRDHVQAGGGLLVVLGDRSGSAWPSEHADLLPGTLGPRVDRGVGRGGAMTDVDMSHPVFEVFGQPRSGDLGTAAFFRYRRVTPGTDDVVIARFDDGAPAIVERRVGEGRILVWATSIDTYWNTAPLQPIFVPLVHQIVTYASGYTEADLFETVGGVVNLDPLLSDADTDGSVLQAMRSGSGLVIATPSGDRIRADSGAALFDPQESGFYEVRSDAEPGGPAVVIATNVDVSESQMTAVNIEEFIGAIARPAQEGEGMIQAAALPVEDQERRQGLWWYLLLAVLMLFGAETVVSNRLSRAARR